MIPTALLAVIAAALVLVTRRRLGLGRNESVQTVVVFLAVIVRDADLIGVFLRGPGMALTVPWGG